MSSKSASPIRAAVCICVLWTITPGRALFDEFRAGRDHLEFLVLRRSDLDIWAARLDDLGIPHSGIKEPSYTSNSMITFRDPDNIQLEFFWAAALSTTPGRKAALTAPARCG
jgi:hypothetical protein